MDDLNNIAAQAKAAISAAADGQALDAVRVEFLGKKGRVTELL